MTSVNGYLIKRVSTWANSGLQKRLKRVSKSSTELTYSARAERGSAVVEFALVLPLLVTILFGAIDFGFVSSDSTKLRQVVREAGRRASVWRFGRSICDDSTPGNTQWKLTGNHALGGAPYSKLMAEAEEEMGSRLSEARKLQCQLKLLGREAGLDVRSKILVAAFPMDHTGITAVVPLPAGFVFNKENADPLPPVVSGVTPVDLQDVSFAVVICAQYKTSSRTGLFGPLLNHKILRSSVSMRIARLNATPKPFYPGAIEEDPFTVEGRPGSWDDCKATPA
jgi:TadE-like protein